MTDPIAIGAQIGTWAIALFVMAFQHYRPRPIEQKENDLNALIEHRNVLEGEVAAAKSTLQDQKKEFTARIEALERQLHTQEVAVERLRNEMTQHLWQIERLQRDNSDLQKENARLSSLHTSTQEKLEAAIRESAEHKVMAAVNERRCYEMAKREGYTTKLEDEK